MSKGTIIFLNGTSSSGKTTLTRALQATLARPFYHLAHDLFSHLVSPTHRQADYWALLNQSMSAMHHTIALFSDLGLDVIVDHCLLDMPQEQTWLPECVHLLHTYPVLFVRVKCSLAELERREHARGDRQPGQARAQINQIHGHQVYDLTVDTEQSTPEECAARICAALHYPERWIAFHTLYERWSTAV